MWEISNNSQLFNFLLAIIAGMIFSVFYDVFRAVRICFTFKDLTVAVQDIIYFLFVSLATFCLLLITVNGQIRGYILFGIIVGFVVFKLLFSKYITKIFVFLIKILKTVFIKLSGVFSLILRLLGGIFEKIIKFITKIAKKVKNTCKLLLQNINKLLYNKANNDCGNGVLNDEAQK